MHMGLGFILANISVDFRGDITTGEMSNTIDRLGQRTKSRFSEVQRILSRPNHASSAGLDQKNWNHAGINSLLIDFSRGDSID